MEIPKKINILSTVYDVEILKGNSYLLGKGVDAEIDFIEKAIRIQDNSNINIYKDLLHEIVHGVIRELFLLNDNDDEEKIVQGLSSVLSDTLIRNNLVLK